MTGASADALGFIRLTEVGPRDGLQNEQRLVSTAAKVEFVAHVFSFHRSWRYHRLEIGW